MPRLRLAAALALVAATLGVALWLPFRQRVYRSTYPAWSAATVAHGSLAVREGLAVVALSGPPAERGAAHGRLVAAQLADLLAIMGLNPLPALRRPHLDGCLAAITPADRAEMAAIAAAAGQDPLRILVANAMVETLCSAVVRLRDGAAPVVARNMDFFPPAALGQSTMVQIVREPGRRTYAAVGWPGMVGVISGMNDAGLTACILLNWQGADLAPGEPLPLRVRRILQQADGIEAALAVLRASPTGSPHYVLLVDRADAALAWWTPTGVRVERPAGGWLTVTNLPRGESGGIRDEDLRGQALVRAVAGLAGAEPDPAWFRRVPSASYMPLDNAQAMVFAPGPRRLELALADTGRAAALAPWRSLDLGPVLDGAPPDTLMVERLPPEPPMRHYLLGGAD